MLVYHGVVKDNMVALPEDAQLEEGTEVEVRPLLPKDDYSAEAAEEAFKQELVRIGLLKRIRRPARVPSEGDRTPIKIEGTLSKAVIEDRR